MSALVSLSPRPTPAGGGRESPGGRAARSANVRLLESDQRLAGSCRRRCDEKARSGRAAISLSFPISSCPRSSSRASAGRLSPRQNPFGTPRSRSRRREYPAARRPMRSPRPMAPKARRREFPPLRPVANEAGPSGGTSGISPSEGGINSCGASAGGGDAMNSDRFISTLRNPIERKIEANCSPAHPVSEVIWPLTTNPFDLLGPPAARAARAWPSTIAARIMPARRSSTSTRTIRSPHGRYPATR